MSAKPKRLLVIAGSDSSGGAGIQADIKVASLFGAYAMTAITGITAQNTLGVKSTHLIPAETVRDQIRACLTDIGADVIKIGMLGSAEIVECVAGALRKFSKGVPIVLDPVMVSTVGKRLLARNAVSILATQLLPLATLVTPNLPEARALTGVPATDRQSAEVAGRKLLALGATGALIKGGHATKETVDDVLVWQGGVEIYAFPRIHTKHTHGTGCVLSTAISCGLAEGLSLPLAVSRAREFLQHAIETAPGLGNGSGPLNLLQRKR